MHHVIMKDIQNPLGLGFKGRILKPEFTTTFVLKIGQQFQIWRNRAGICADA